MHSCEATSSSVTLHRMWRTVDGRHSWCAPLGTSDEAALRVVEAGLSVHARLARVRRIYATIPDSFRAAAIGARIAAHLVRVHGVAAGREGDAPVPRRGGEAGGSGSEAEHEHRSGQRSIKRNGGVCSQQRRSQQQRVRKRSNLPLVCCSRTHCPAISGQPEYKIRLYLCTGNLLSV
jgi:hypothetical protein